MQFMKLGDVERAEALASLASMHPFLRRSFAGLTPSEALQPGPGGGLRAFAAARKLNLDRIQSLSPGEWLRGGTQEGVGRVSLCDLPAMILQHDQAHAEEIRGWQRFTGYTAGAD